MRNKSARKEFQIALLMEDVVEAKTISDGLREIGIYAHFYQDLDELWVALNTHTPDLCIVDVKRMSQGSLLFKQHPKVKNNQLKFAFYYKDATQVLLNSTFGLNHYGLIRAELNLVDQLKSVLMRRNEELRLIEQADTLEGRINRLKVRSVRLTEAQEQNQREQKQNAECEELINAVGKTKSMGEFNKRLVYLFSEWDRCLEFGIYQLNSTNQKLVSLKSRKAKYKNLPDLWLSAECNEGIDPYATEMAYDVCYGLMDDGLISVNIKGAFNNPSMMLIGRFDKKNTDHFNWKALETKLSAEYRRLLLQDMTTPAQAGHTDSIFNTLQQLDDIHFHQVENTHRYALVDFSSLVSMVKQRSSNRFYWRAFASEFSAELGEILSGNFRISHYGVEAFLVGIDKKHIETDYNALKSYVEGFQFWRYFEDSSIIVSHDLAPEVRFVAPSSVNIVRQMQDGSADFMQPAQDNVQTRSNLEV